MTGIVLLPFHQDERLSASHVALPAGLDHQLLDPALPHGSQWERLVVLYDALADQVSERVRRGNPTAIVTGDCLATIGSLVGLQRAGLAPSLVWFDAHGDVHTIESSASGYLGGMALRMALGGDADRLCTPLGLRPLQETQALLVDARDLDPAEHTYLAETSVQRVRVEDVDPTLVPGGPILVHVDVDVIDASEIPGLRFPANGGPSSEAVLAAIGRLLASGRVVALDVAAPWHPPVSADEKSTRQALLASLIHTLS